MQLQPPLLALILTITPSLACSDDKGATTDAATSATATTDSATATTDNATATATATTDSATATTDSATATTDNATTGSTTGAPYLRECQEGDFVCDDWGCELPPAVRPGECYKPCTPSEVGALDDECDEPERPYCSQVGLALGGDYVCNSCAHICVSATIDQCSQGVDGCPG